MTKLLTPHEAGRALGKSHWTIRRYWRDKKLRSIVVGGRRYVREDDLQQFLDSASDAPRLTGFALPSHPQNRKRKRQAR